MTTFDCFTFNDELDLLEFRLRYLEQVVDRVVIVEAPRTYSGIEKPLHFAEHRDRYRHWDDRIIHVVVDDLPLPVDGDRWVPENFQHTAIERGLGSAVADDVILVMDLDEIPDADLVATFRNGLAAPASLEMTTAYYKANFVTTSPWSHPKVAPFEALGDPCALRLAQDLPQAISDAGTHLSYLMDVEQMARKVRAFAHSEFDNDRDLAPRHLERCVRHGVEQFGRGTIFTQLQRNEFSPVLRAAYEYEPRWFDFSPLPPMWRRVAVSRYARWRRTRMAAPRIVEYLDEHFDSLAPGLSPALKAYDVALRARTRLSGPRAIPYHSPPGSTRH